MRIRPNQENGNVLVISMALGVILGGILAGYLQLVTTLDALSARAKTWSLAIAAAEAGVAEGLTQINYTNNWFSNGWQSNNGVFTRSQFLGENYYTVGISNPSAPVVYSTGYVSWPRTTNYISRVIRVTTQRPSMFAKGLLARGTMSFSGGVRTDSFNSSDPNWSTNGRYDGRFRDNGDVGTISGAANAISANGGVNIFGTASTGPNGTIGLSGQVAIGSKAFIQGGGAGIQSGWSSSDMSYNFTDVSGPFSGGAFTPVSGTVSGTNYTYVIGDGNYQLSNLSMSGQNKAIVNGNAVLYVTGNISLSGQSFIYIATNASLQLYCAGASASLTGQGVANVNANATNFFYYGLPSNTSVSLSGNAAFTGVIYAPEAAFSMSGGGNNNYDLVGAAVANTISMSGHFNFHYDENLMNLGGNTAFLIKSWTEL